MLYHIFWVALMVLFFLTKQELAGDVVQNLKDFFRSMYKKVFFIKL